MHAADLIAELARSLGLPGLRLSELGTAALVVDGELALNLEPEDTGTSLLAYLSLGEIPVEGREAVYADLLAANLFGHDSGGGTVALDRAGGELLLFRRFELEHTDALGFEAALAELIAAARRLRARLAAAPGVAGAASGVAAELPHHLAALMRA